MNTCSQCGVSIPDKQRFCSMCYGDPYYGHDGYYLAWLEEQQQHQAWEEQEIQEPQPEHEPNDF